MLAIVIPDLNGLWEIGVCAEIRCKNALERPQHIEVCVRICPQPRKLVVVNEEMHALALRVLAAFRVVKADKAISIARFRNKARRVEFTRTAINHFVHSAAPPIHKAKAHDARAPRACYGFMGIAARPEAEPKAASIMPTNPCNHDTTGRVKC